MWTVAINLQATCQILIKNSRDWLNCANIILDLWGKHQSFWNQQNHVCIPIMEADLMKGQFLRSQTRVIYSAEINCLDCAEWLSLVAVSLSFTKHHRLPYIFITFAAHMHIRRSSRACCRIDVLDVCFSYFLEPRCQHKRDAQNTIRLKSNELVSVFEACSSVC